MPTTRPTHHTARPQPRGSAIILVIISVILLALLGATYLQITRFERLAAPEQGNIELVLQSIITKAATTLGEDIVINGDEAFDSRGSIANPDAVIEPYDYPWTVGMTTTLTSEPTGNPVLAAIDDLDDKWMATTFVSVALEWEHISNLCGWFIDLDSTTTGPAAAIDINNADDIGFALAQTTNVPANSIGAVDVTQFADADDDGLADSRWAFPPLFEIGGIRYAFAIRIVDLSARVNLNTAQALLTNGGSRNALAAQEAPRGSNPGDVSLAGFAADQYGAGHRDDVFTLLQYRYGLTGTFPRPHLTVGGANQYDRIAFWENGGSRLRANGVLEPEADFNGTPITYQPLPLADTVELLTRNGLSDGAASSTVEGADLGGGTLDTLLRATTNEDTQTGDTYAGGTPGFFTNEARKWLTTHSGVGDFAMPIDVASAARRALQRQLNVNDPTANAADEMADALRGLFDNGTLVALPSAMAFDEFTDRLAASASDFADTDNQPTLVGTRAGFEPLPMITEVYIQVPYEITAVVDNGGIDDVTIDRAGDIGYAIEIGNPFGVAISLENVTVKLGGDNIGTLDTITGETELAAGESIVLKGPVGAFVAPGPNPDVDTANTLLVNLNDEEYPEDGTEVTLEVEAEDGTMVVYHRFTTPGIVESETINGWTGDGTNGNAVPADGQVHYRVFRRYGYFTGLDLLRVGDGAGAEAPAATDAEPFENYLFYNTTASELGLDKQALPGNFMSAGIPEQVIIRDIERMDYIGDLAFVLAVGPSTTQTLPEVWGNQTQLLNHRLPAPGSSVKNPTIDALRVDYLTLAMARLSTVAPFRDGIDNDSSGTVDDEAENAENFIPGKINVNTAPDFLIEATLPFENATLREDVADAIVAMRDNPAAPGRTRTNVGLAYIGELFRSPEITTDAPTPGGNLGDDLLWDATMPIDWNNADTSGDGIADTLDGITDDLDEQLLLAKVLPQMYTTRSDVYAAYILINGYDGATLTETLRAIVIFQRANVRQGGDLAEVLGVFRF
ncbi:MAG: hypothetical protein AAF750_15360 [Planctomycetota bacterium]